MSRSSRRPPGAVRRRAGAPAGAPGPGRPGRRGPDPAYLYVPEYVTDEARGAILAWLETLHPLWELRYSTRRAPPAGRAQRRLLRPVYWLGNWQFACLDYYRPPRGVKDRCVAAEPFPPVLARIVADVERRVRRGFPPRDVPRGWRLNTCLVNFYGSRLEGERWIDCARVGEHRDFEPGPVASVSLGERALLQFVGRRGSGEGPVLTQWLDDGSLQVFGGPRWKDQTLHRVQRVDRKLGIELPPAIEGFRTRRVNFTFRYVPDQHVVRFAKLSATARADVRPYLETLAAHSAFFRAELAG
jgi:DNA oxidative demethylase